LAECLSVGNIKSKFGDDGGIIMRPNSKAMAWICSHQIALSLGFINTKRKYSSGNRSLA
jgi:hypothetical protein